MRARQNNESAAIGPLLWLIGPVVFIVLFFIVPLSQVVWQSAFDAKQHWNLEPYRTVFSSSYYLRVITYTLWLSAKVTVYSVLLGYPVAYFIASLRSRWARKICIILTVTPLFTSNIVRSFAWIIILGRNGVANDTLQALRITSEPLSLLYNDFSITVGLVYIMLPFVILSVYSSLQNINESVLEAASDLGANAIDRFRTVIWPLSMPGVISGAIIVFSLTGSAYVTPMVMSGSKISVLSMLVYQQYAVVFDERVGGALSVILLVLTIGSLGACLAALRIWQAVRGGGRKTPAFTGVPA